jgi:hypothetical protein
LKDQISSEADEGGARRLVMSRTAEVEDGARAALLLADGLFRLDLVVMGDTLRTIVRNLSSGPLEMERRAGDGYAQPDLLPGAQSLHPSRTRLAFEVDGWRVDAQLAVIGTGEPGSRHVTAQAIAVQSRV